MKKRILQMILSLTLCFGIYYAAGQDTAHIGVRSRVQKNAVLLRWAASSPASWKQTNRCGFNIERYTIVRDGSLLANPEMKKLNQTPVKARPLHEWETPVQNSDYAAVIAQALYGEDFETSGGEQGIARIINLSQEQEQRFAMSLYAADLDFEAACMAGWGWRDNTVRQGERYLYRVIPALPDGGVSLNIEQGSSFAAMDEYEELPKPVGLSAIFGDKSVMLVWDFGMLSNIYNSYYIEKSADGKTFKRMEGIPVTSMNGGQKQPTRRMYFSDSLTDNNSKHYYRIRGVSYFGEIGPASDSIAGKGETPLPYAPGISRASLNGMGELELEWEFDVRGNNLIKSFELSRSDFADRNYTAVVQNIDPARRSLVFKDLKPVNYFVIAAIPHNGIPRRSFSVLVQPADSVPPAMPQGLKGWIDSAGAAILRWNANIETDLLGYRVFRTFTKNGEPVPLFDIAIKDSAYRDSIDINSMNRKVYYSVMAVDMRYNQSETTPLLELEKPDIFPTAPPVISDYRIRKEGIEIQWINSADSAVTQYRVWRREKSSGYAPSTLIKSVSARSVSAYVDTSAVAGVNYIYTLTAIKGNWIESQPSNEVTVSTGFGKRQDTGLAYFNAVVDRENRMLKLEWDSKLSDIQQYELYRGENGENPTLWKTLEKDRHEIIDENIQLNTHILYIIRAVLQNGKITESKTIKIDN
jgi:hypothetical protein